MDTPAAPTSPIVVDTPPMQAWLVWFDLACDDVLALAPPDMTPALSRELAAAGIEVIEVQAPTRKEAIDKAFPEDHPLRPLVKRLPGGVRRPGVRAH